MTDDPKTTNPTQINVTSHNQMGGITAGTVNLVGRPQLVMEDGLMAEIARAVASYPELALTSIGGQRSMAAADTLQTYLENAGHTVQRSRVGMMLGGPDMEKPVMVQGHRIWVDASK